MDRPIESHVLRRRRWSRGAAAVGALVLIVVALLGLRRLITPELDADRLRVDEALRGAIEVTVQASGTVVPRSEQVIAAPVASRVMAIHRRVGDPVAAGELLLDLDPGATRLTVEQTRSEIELKRNDRRTRELRLRDRVAELESQVELKRIDLESQKAKHARLQRLADDEIVSDEELAEAGFDIRRSEVEIRQKASALDNERETARAELDKIASEVRVLEQRLLQQEATLDRANARATRAGVLTFLIEETGTAVTEGQTIARVADLGTYRVDATLSDAYASRLTEGQPARVALNRTMLSGTLTKILPTIEDGALNVQIELDEPATAGLRSNLRVDVYLVTERRDDVVTIAKGPAFNGAGRQEAFVVGDGVARRREITLGLASYDRWEVTDGLDPGERLIVSDTSTFEHMSKIAIRGGSLQGENTP